MTWNRDRWIGIIYDDLSRFFDYVKRATNSFTRRGITRSMIHITVLLITDAADYYNSLTMFWEFLVTRMYAVFFEFLSDFLGISVNRCGNVSVYICRWSVKIKWILSEKSTKTYFQTRKKKMFTTLPPKQLSFHRCFNKHDPKCASTLLLSVNLPGVHCHNPLAVGITSKWINISLNLTIRIFVNKLRRSNHINITQSTEYFKHILDLRLYSNIMCTNEYMSVFFMSH